MAKRLGAAMELSPTGALQRTFVDAAEPACAVAVAVCTLLVFLSCGNGRAPESRRHDGYGSIQVNSTPSVAAIALDGAGTGKTTPYLLADVAAGRHGLGLTKDGYAAWDSTVMVTQGQTTTIDAGLSQSFGGLDVNSAPPGAAISLDGTSTGKTTPYLFANVAGGSHDLGLTKDGCPDWDSTVTVGQGETTLVMAMLRPQSDSRWITYANAPGSYGMDWLVFSGPERAVRFDPRDSGFGYPLHVVKVSAVFYSRSGDPWPDSSFRFKVYGGNGRNLLYQSPVIEAVPGEPGPAVVHQLTAPVRLDTGGFYLAVAPVHKSGYPSSYCSGDPNRRPASGPVPPDSEATPRGRSYSGSPGRWVPLEQGELSFAVLLRPLR
jgi:hypothetical protein